MTENKFWEIIAESNKNAHGSQDVQRAALRKILLKLDAAEVIAFDRIFTEMLYKSYAWDLWGAAYIIDGGCSDDGFEYFRRGLVAAGRQKFENALRDAESLADWANPDEVEFEGIHHVADEVYQEKTGAKKMPNHGLKHPNEPSGEDWSANGDDLENRFPNLWEKFGA